MTLYEVPGSSYSRADVDLTLRTGAGDRLCCNVEEIPLTTPVSVTNKMKSRFLNAIITSDDTEPHSTEWGQRIIQPSTNRKLSVQE